MNNKDHIQWLQMKVSEEEEFLKNLMMQLEQIISKNRQWVNEEADEI